MPALKSGPAHELARPYKGPYRIVQLFPNGAEVKLVDNPRAPTIRVALNRVRRSPTQPEESVTEVSRATNDERVEESGAVTSTNEQLEESDEFHREEEIPLTWKGRLRP